MKTSSRVQLHVGRPGSMLQMTKSMVRPLMLSFCYIILQSNWAFDDPVWMVGLNLDVFIDICRRIMSSHHASAVYIKVHPVFTVRSLVNKRMQCRNAIGQILELHYKIGDHDFHCFLFQAENAWGLIEPSNVFSSGLGWSLGKGRGLHQGSHGNFLSSGFLARQEVSWCGRRNGWCHEV